MKKTISEHIVEFLKKEKVWVFGGTLEGFVHRQSGCKGSTASRIARLLAEEGIIKNKYVKVKGVHVKVVMYHK